MSVSRNKLHEDSLLGESVIDIVACETAILIAPENFWSAKPRPPMVPEEIFELSLREVADMLAPLCFEKYSSMNKARATVHNHEALINCLRRGMCPLPAVRFYNMAVGRMVCQSGRSSCLGSSKLITHRTTMSKGCLNDSWGSSRLS